jgi:hypothetical protein
MASLNQIIALLAERADREFSIPFQEEMKVLVNNWRSRLIANSLQKKPQDRKFFIQSIVVPLTNISKVTCPIVTGCVLITPYIPSPIRVNSIIFDFVGTPDFEIAFGQALDFQNYYLSFNKYIGSKGRYAWENNKLKIFNKTEMQAVGIQGISGDYQAFKNLDCGSTPDCDPDDLPYPVSPELEELIISSILKEELNRGVPKPNNRIDVNENIN